MNIQKKIILATVLTTSIASASDDSVTELGVSTNPIAIQGDAVLTQAEIDAAFTKVPENIRLPYIRDGERVDLLIQVLLKNRQFANEAREAGYADENLVRLRMELAAEKELAEMWQERLMQNMPAADYEALAYETFLASPDTYFTETTVDVSHILISSENKPVDEAEAVANELHARLKEDPALFDEMIMEYSEDPSKRSNGGRFSAVKPGQMVKAFEVTAFSLKEVGDISLPVRTNYGFHLIRLNARADKRPLTFDEIKPQLIEQEKKEHAAKFRSRYTKKLISEEIVIPKEGVEEMVKRYFGDDMDISTIQATQ